MKYRYGFEEKKKRVCVVAACVFVVLAGIVYLYNRQDGSGYIITASVNESDAQGQQVSESEELQDNTGEENVTAEYIAVHVCGAVKNAGVYELPLSSRVSDAIEAAGGFGKKAARDYLNLAVLLEDGQKIYVPTRKEAAKQESNNVNDTETDGNSPGNSEEADSGRVNINTADRTELMTLPGVGEAKADSIIAYRQENGRFAAIEDIMKITGIKEGLFSKISDKITVD